MTKKLEIDVWSDIVCPWCAIGDRRLETALAQFAHRDDVEVTWHAFELDPSAPALREGDQVEHLATKYGRTTAQAQQMIQNVIDTAAKDGLDFQLFRAKSGNTFDGHRVLCMAAAKGLQAPMKERLFRAYMTEGEAIGDREVLVRLASEVGLDATEVRAMLASKRYAEDVRKDEATARSLGVSGVPFFVLGKRLAVSGAQPAELLLRALDEAWEGTADAPDAAEGAVCGPDGCA